MRAWSVSLGAKWSSSFNFKLPFQHLQLPESLSRKYSLRLLDEIISMSTKSDTGRANHCRRDPRVVEEICLARGEFRRDVRYNSASRTVQWQIAQADAYEEQENSEDTLARLGSRVAQLWTDMNWFCNCSHLNMCLFVEARLALRIVLLHLRSTFTSGWGSHLVSFALLHPWY